MKRYVLIILILLTVMFLPTVGKEIQKTTPELPKLSTSILLLIRGDRELKNEVRRHISKELQSLGDVKIVRIKPEWFLDIHAHQIYAPRTKKSLARPFGFMLSIVIFRPTHIDSKTLKSLSEGRINDKDCDTLRGYIGQTFSFPSHMVWSGKDLQSLCREAITYFDTKLLRPDIESIREEREAEKQKMEEEREKVRALREKIRKERGNKGQ